MGDHSYLLRELGKAATHAESQGDYWLANLTRDARATVALVYQGKVVAAPPPRLASDDPDKHARKLLMRIKRSEERLMQATVRARNMERSLADIGWIEREYGEDAEDVLSRILKIARTAFDSSFETLGKARRQS